MGTELVCTCPSCGDEQTFHRMASTTLHLGEKTKWYCGSCGHRIVRIDGSVDTASA
jgi:uncharacterized Zn finger protein